jgi:hypothetical protein
MPTNVTVFYDITPEKGVIDNRFPLVTALAWKAAWTKHYTKIFVELDEQKKIFTDLGDFWNQEIENEPSVFVSAEAAKKCPVEYAEPKKASTKDFGYDMTKINGTVTTRYILMYRINHYGFVVDNISGPFIDYGIVLYDREQNEIVWTYSDRKVGKMPGMTYGAASTEKFTIDYPELARKSVHDIIQKLKK